GSQGGGSGGQSERARAAPDARCRRHDAADGAVACDGDPDRDDDLARCVEDDTGGDVMAATNRAGDASLGDLLSTMAGDVGVLVRKELELAKVETKAEISRAGKVGGAFGGT